VEEVVIADRMNGKGALARLVAAAAEMSSDAVEYLENDPQTAGLGKAVEEFRADAAVRPPYGAVLQEAANLDRLVTSLEAKTSAGT
jgi:hypothetical protein